MVDDSEKDAQGNAGGAIISDLVLNTKSGKDARGGLVVEPQQSEEGEAIQQKIDATLKETEQHVIALDQASDPDRARSWERARTVITDFSPVPWFIWRLSNFVLGKSGRPKNVSEGLVFGLRRLLFAAASDPLLGTGEKVNNVRKAIEVLSPDVIAAMSVIHAVCRRLGTRQFERIWRPILDDAVLRTRIGYMVGLADPEFGAGRGMLAGFAGRCGLTILIASGELEQARSSLELLAAGKPISEVGLGIYQCDPLQVSAMLLSAAGCGREAAFGTAAYANPKARSLSGESDEQRKWLAAFSICENVRMSKREAIAESDWAALGYSAEPDRDLLFEEAKKMIRRGHEWGWLMQ